MSNMVVTGLCVGLILGMAASARAQARSSDAGAAAPRALLAALCGEDSPEPTCKAVAGLSPDEAWLVLNHACRKPTWQNTAPCTTFMMSHGGVLTFNLKTDEWTAQWEQASYPLKFDVTGAPTLRLKPRDAKPLKIVVSEISPLTYSATPGVPKEDDLAIVAGLKSFLALAGTGLQGLVQTIAFASAAGPPAAPGSGAFQPSSADRGGRGSLSSRGDAPKECTIGSPDVLPAAAQVTRRHEQLVHLGAAMAALEKALDDVEKARVAFIRAAQQAEDGAPVAASDLVKPNPGELQSAYDSFDASVKGLVQSSSHLASCQPLLGAYATLIGAPVDGRVIHDLASRVAAIPGCADSSVSSLRDSILANAMLLTNAAIKDPAVCTPAKLKLVIETHRDAMKPLVERLINAKQVEEKVWAAIDKAGAARKEVRAGVAVLSRQVDRGLRHTWDNQLIRELVVTRPNPSLSWNKVQSHEVVMKADTPYLKELSLARGAEEKRPYKLESATGQLLGYGIGLTYTPLHESTYAAVTVPGTSTKVIAETKRETRAGDLGAFLSYRFTEHRPAARRHVRPTVDFGVGVTSDRPAFFLGGGLEILRAGRIGFGWTAQRISDLAENQTPDVTIVSSTDDIKTVKRFDTGTYYLSVTFALDSLSLFNSK